MAYAKCPPSRSAARSAASKPERTVTIGLARATRGGRRITQRQARQNLLLPGLLGDRADVLVDDDPLRVHQEGFRRTVHPPHDRLAPVAIDRDARVRIAR